VGTLLGFISRFSIVRIRIDESKCTRCGLCERRCKSSCIDSGNLTVDASRCVGCFDCVAACKSSAVRYSPCKSRVKEQNSGGKEKISRRTALSVIAMMIGGGALRAQQLKVDGGLADIEDKKVPDRKTPVVPPGAVGAANQKQHCTACQLCVAACPNGILRPSHKLSTLMQPEITFERGFCRPECVECSLVCPPGAIKPVTTAEKSALSIGWAVWIESNCVVNADQLPCDSCQRHCPTGAITLVERRADPDDKLRIPVVDKGLCIGCGACEHFCPARPLSAIYVEGNQIHHSI
jgi:ferredoxin